MTQEQSHAAVKKSLGIRAEAWKEGAAKVGGQEWSYKRINEKSIIQNIIPPWIDFLCVPHVNVCEYWIWLVWTNVFFFSDMRHWGLHKTTFLMGNY